uniref:(northern house mosquito) hypothetical protein n=1 Tax=Culex pipiens TaxID=7175 RepID=A0A8D8NDI8_CULPI
MLNFAGTSFSRSELLRAEHVEVIVAPQVRPQLVHHDHRRLVWGERDRERVHGHRHRDALHAKVPQVGQIRWWAGAVVEEVALLDGEVLQNLNLCHFFKEAYREYKVVQI